MQIPPEKDWIDQVQARGWGDALSTALELIQPLGPLAAQFLWIVQPAAGLFGRRDQVAALANLLEEPEALEQIRRRLEKEESQ